MSANDFRHNEKSVVMPAEDKLAFVLVKSDGSEEVLKSDLKV